jgi:hypothetical protein
VSRSTVLSALLVAVAAFGVGSCSAAEQEQFAQRLERAAKTTKEFGMVITMTGTVSAGVVSQPLRSRMTIAPGGRRARMSTKAGDLSLEQYLDGRFMLTAVDSFPGARTGLPPGTRYIKVDMDRIGKSLGLDMTMSQMQSMDPSRIAALLADVAEVRSLGSGTIDGAKVSRYVADVDNEKLAKAVSSGDDAAAVSKLFGHGTMQMQLALDDADGRIRGFGMKGDMGPAKVDMDAVVQSYSRQLKVTIPSRGVYDITDTITGAFDASSRPER